MQSSNHNDSNDGDDEQEVLAHLDPSVAALLMQKDDDDDNVVSVNDLRVQIAHCKLQQSRIRGNSDYAAKIMEHAIEEGARDKAAWTLLGKHISKLETRVSDMTTTNTATGTNRDISTDSCDEQTATNEEENNDNEDSNKKASSEGQDDNDLRQRLELESERANHMEELLEQCLHEEIKSILAEQTSIKERQERVRSRIRFLQLTLKQSSSFTTDGSSNNNNSNPLLSTDKITKLQNAMKDVYEYTNDYYDDSNNNNNNGSNNNSSGGSSYCSICHERPANRAVLPCGHLCLCDVCTYKMTQMDASGNSNGSSNTSSSRQCPLCRGHLLSTLHIYMPK